MSGGFTGSTVGAAAPAWREGRGPAASRLSISRPVSFQSAET
jgi:hypothetical protein